MQILINVILQMKTTKQIYQNRWFHTILNNKTTIYEKNKHTHLYLEQVQQLEFLWVLFHSSSL